MPRTRGALGRGCDPAALRAPEAPVVGCGAMAPKTALVIIDVQHGLLAGEQGVRAPEALLENLRRLLAAARRSGAPVLFVQDDDVGEVGSHAWEIPDAIRPEPGEIRVRKLACDAFHETNLDAQLRERGVDHLIIAGCKTEYCIDTSVRRAVTLGYGVTLASDAHATSDSPALPAAAIIAHHNRVLDGFGAYVAGRPCEVAVRRTAEIEP
jgi:nicotinamidase-related amidase